MATFGPSPSVETSSTSDAMPPGSSSDDPDTTGTSGEEPEPTSTSGSDETGEEPAFECDPVVADSPVLAGEIVFDPAAPSPGDTLTVIVRSTNGTGRSEAPPMALEVTSADGVAEHASQSVEGGDAVYYYAVPDVPRGDLCLTGLVDGQPEVATKITVNPRPPDPPMEGGIYKITANHQWRCDEQPGNGNELHVWVRDAAGVGIANKTVSVMLADSTDEGSIYNGEAETVLTEIVTGDDGHGQAYNYWPVSDTGLLVFKMAVAGAASDIATEITTGWWEDDLMGCNYCNIPTVNVWGHWSYTVEFQLDPTATEICVVENDHAGMNACGEPRHVHHHPDVRACWAHT